MSTRYYEETPCPECGRYHQESLLRPGGDPESSIAYCYVGGQRRELTGGEPDYKAAHARASEIWSWSRIRRDAIEAIVDAAIGDRLLINPPPEEER